MPLNRDGKRNPNNRRWEVASGAAPGSFTGLSPPLARHTEEADGVDIPSQ